jgi:hypothetical protein
MDMSVGAPRLDAVRAWGTDMSVGAPHFDALRAWGLRMHRSTLDQTPSEGQAMCGRPPPRRRPSVGGDGPERGRPTP